METKNTTVDKLKIPQKACSKCTIGCMDYHNPHLWSECNCQCHYFIGNDSCEDKIKE